jgi:hypothetical protein
MLGDAARIENPLVPTAPGTTVRTRGAGGIAALVGWRGAAVPVVPTGVSGVNVETAPTGTGGALGATAACGGRALVDALTATGKDGERLPVVPARSPRRGRSYGCMSPRPAGTSTMLYGSTVVSA